MQIGHTKLVNIFFGMQLFYAFTSQIKKLYLFRKPVPTYNKLHIMYVRNKYVGIMAKDRFLCLTSIVT